MGRKETWDFVLALLPRGSFLPHLVCGLPTCRLRRWVWKTPKHLDGWNSVGHLPPCAQHRHQRSVMAECWGWERKLTCGNQPETNARQFDGMPGWVDQTSRAWFAGWNSCKGAVHPYALQAPTEGGINNTTCTCMCDYFSNHRCCCHEWNRFARKWACRQTACRLLSLISSSGPYKDNSYLQWNKIVSGLSFKILQGKKAGGGRNWERMLIIIEVGWCLHEGLWCYCLYFCMFKVFHNKSFFSKKHKCSFVVMHGIFWQGFFVERDSLWKAVTLLR